MSSKRPILSVVSASWNQGCYAKDCIESLGSGEHPEVEHLVIDNCSDDETKEVLARFPGVRAIIEPDHGQSEALNKGFRKARGEWVLWLNIDDFLLPGVLGRYLDIIRAKGEELDVLYGHMRFVDREGGKIRTVYQPQWSYWMTAFGGYAIPSTGTVFRRQVLLDSPLDEDFHMIMDTEWTLRAGPGLRVRRFHFEAVAFRLADNKTAAHVTDGELTPRHAAEREILYRHYPDFPLPGRQTSGFWPSLTGWMKRKAVRFWVLIQKAGLKMTAR